MKTSLLSMLVLLVVLFNCVRVKCLLQTNNKHALISRLRLSQVSGGNGENFHFLPIAQGGIDEYLPKILPVDGFYGSLNQKDIAHCTRSAAQTADHEFQYYFPSASDMDTGLVAVSGCEQLEHAIEPFVIVAKSSDLRVASQVPVEVLVVVDHGDTQFDPDAFFLCETSSGSLVIQWMTEQSLPILGKVVLCVLPPKKEREETGGFLENEDI